MSRVTELAKLMKELEDQLIVCMRCGMCQAVCPLFAETGREADVARGKLALLDGLIQEMFKDPGGVSQRLHRCLLCGSCAANCPSGVKVLDIFIKARAILAGYMGLSPLKKVIFQKMLAQPDLFNRIVEYGARFQGVFTQPVDELLGTSCSRFLSPLGENRHMKLLADVPFHKKVPSMNTAAGASKLKVGFFVGCLIDKVFPHIGEATLNVLEHHGVGVWMPEGQGCCGIPALASGDTQTFSRLVRLNAQKFHAQQFDYLVTACATCTSTIKKLWPMMTQELSFQEQLMMEAMAQKTLDINQFLVDKVGVGKGDLEWGGKKTLVTYHDPCHLKKSLGVAAQPRILLQANPNCQLREMSEADRCCGCGGSFNLQHYDLSASIGSRKRDHIKNSGCSVVATGCPACMLHITDMLSQAGDRIQVKHPVEIYWEFLSTFKSKKPCMVSSPTAV